MKVLITGGAGFFGRRPAGQLLARGRLAGPDGTPQRIDGLVLLDMIKADGSGDPRVTPIVGDITNRGVLDAVIDASTQVIFHLTAVVNL